MADIPVCPEADIESIVIDVKVCGYEAVFRDKTISMKQPVAEVMAFLAEDEELLDVLKDEDGPFQLRVFPDDGEPFIPDQNQNLHDNLANGDIIGIELHIEGSNCSTTFDDEDIIDEQLVKFKAPPQS